MRKYLFDLTKPINMEYLFNGIRVLHSIPTPWATVLAPGTTSVETVCRRVNKLAQAQGDKICDDCRCSPASFLATIRGYLRQSYRKSNNAGQSCDYV